jgi:hypothetical protein
MAPKQECERHPNCKDCGKAMLFSCREEAEPGFEHRIFQCKRCFSVEQRVLAVPPTVDKSIEVA